MQVTAGRAQVPSISKPAPHYCSAGPANTWTGRPPKRATVVFSIGRENNAPGAGSASPLPDVATAAKAGAQAQSRRMLLASSALLFTASRVGSVAAEPSSAATTGSSSATPEALSQLTFEQPESTADGNLFSTVEFALRVPPGYTKIEQAVPEYSGRGPAPPPPKIQAEFASPDRSEEIVVLVRNASEVRPTFFQVQDISAYGDAKDTAKIIVPRGSELTATSTTKVQFPPRDTGTIKGIVTPPPQTIYRYEFKTRDGVKVAMAAAAFKGKLYVLGASAPADKWSEAGPKLKKAAESFQLNPPI